MYFQGPFWTIGESVRNIYRNEFVIIGEKYLSDIHGAYLDNSSSKSVKTHKRVWAENYESNYNSPDFTYHDRGRVAIYIRVAYIRINSKMNTPAIIDAIVKDYSPDNLEIEVELNDTYQGSHYDFKLP